MSNQDINELKQQCEKIANAFRREADELVLQADDLIESARHIDYLAMSRDVLSMRSLVRIHREVAEGDEDGRQ